MALKNVATDRSAYYHAPVCPPEELLKVLKERLSHDPITGHIIWSRPPQKSPMRPGSLAGTLMPHGHISIGMWVDGARYHFLAHHIAWFFHYGAWPERQIDHRDGVHSNNRIENLRYSTQQENSRNHKLQKNNTTGVTGVSLHHRGKLFTARIRHNKTNIYLGCFSTLRAAQAARLEAEKRLHKDFSASLRPPQGAAWKRFQPQKRELSSYTVSFHEACEVSARLVKGVTWDRKKCRFIVGCYVEKRWVKVGTFSSIEEAKAARLAAEQQAKG